MMGEQAKSLAIQDNLYRYSYGWINFREVWGVCEGSSGSPAKTLPRTYYDSLLPPVPWIMRGENCLLSFSMIVVALILVVGFML